MRKFLFVGAGFSGAVLARHLATHLGAQCLLIDQRDHVAGNCHTSRDPGSGVLVHRYGAHIFNTSNQMVIDYITGLTRMVPYVHRVKAMLPGQGVYGLPINLYTINQVYGVTLSPDQARELLRSEARQDIDTPANFEEQALKFVGEKLYRMFFEGYTRKQWGCDPKELPASILKRLPVRFSYDDSYYHSTYTALPHDGYTSIVERILDHPSLEVRLGVSYEKEMSAGFNHTFFSGPLDGYFGYARGRLGYRTVHWQDSIHPGDFQGTSVMNYTLTDQPFTRIIEHKHFAPWESHEQTYVSVEYSKETGSDDIPYYPKRLAADRQLLEAYLQDAQTQPAVSFIGRLGTYRYMDMHQVIGEALAMGESCVEAIGASQPLPTFPVPPEQLL
jgi:UDP-galactopyranose mutase